MVAARGELAGQPGKETTPADADPRSLAVHRVVEDAQLTAEVLDHALEAKTDPEDREAALEQGLQRPREIEITGRPRSGRQDDEMRRDFVEQDRKSTRLNSSHLGISYA